MIKPLFPKTESTKSEKNPSSLRSTSGRSQGENSHPSTFEFAPSVQSDLFNYLKPHQRAAIKPYLRLIKRPYQEKLCISLMDYLEGHGLEPLEEPVLRQLQNRIIDECNLHPLTSHEPKSIGDLIHQLFGSFRNLSNHSNY